MIASAIGQHFGASAKYDYEYLMKMNKSTHRLFPQKNPFNKFII